MNDLNFNKQADGLIPAIAQDFQTGEILMLAYVDREAWEQSVRTGKATYWSRSRKEIWQKGETSGHVQLIKEIFVDCDEDTIIFKVEQLGGIACHTGKKTCFFRKLEEGKFVLIDKKKS